MLVLTRAAGMAVKLVYPDGYSQVSVQSVSGTRSATLLIDSTVVDNRILLQSRVVELNLGESCRIDEQSAVTLVDVDTDKVRLGIEAPRYVRVYRTELEPGERDDDESGTAGSPCPRPSTPRPTALSVQLAEPQTNDDAQ